MTDEVRISQTVAVLVDGNNIERSIRTLTNNEATMLRFDTVIPRLIGNRSLNRFVYFREGKNISSKLAERLHGLYHGSVRPCHKSADIPLTIKAMQLAAKVDTLIIMSGDSDYIELIKHLKSEGVRVEIAAVEDNTAQILFENADYFHPILVEDCFSYSPSKQTAPHAPRKTSPKAIHRSAPEAKQESQSEKKKVRRRRGGATRKKNSSKAPEA